MWTLWEGDEREGERTKTSEKGVAALSLQRKMGSQLSCNHILFVNFFSPIKLFQANWSNLETTDDENDL